MEEITEKKAIEMIEQDRKEIQKIIEEGGRITKTIIEDKNKIITTIKIKPINGKTTSSTTIQNKDNITISCL